MKFNSGEDGNNPFVSNIIESFKTPQQTSLFGMLRFLILSNDEEAFDKKADHIINKEAADRLIGPKSFSVTEGQVNDFGEILSIGPCSIYNKVNGSFYFRAARAHELSVNFCETVETSINGAERERDRRYRRMESLTLRNAPLTTITLEMTARCRRRIISS